RISDLDNLMEIEPNDNFEQATAALLPIALNGVIDSPNQQDWYKFAAVKDAVYDIECFARRLGSNLDAVINLFDSEQKHLVGNDDGRGLDAYLRWTCPADGEYYLRVRDHLNRGGEDFVYRIEIAPPQPQLSVGIPRVARYSQYRQSIFVPQGGRFGTPFNVLRTNFAGAVKIEASQLPPGVQMVGGQTVGNLGNMPVVFEAAADAPIGGALVDILASHVDNPEIRGGYANAADFVLGPPNNNLYVSGIVDKLPIVVVERLPFSLEIVQPKAPLAREGQMKLKIIAHRDEGFDKPIQLHFPFLPPGVGVSGVVNLAEGQSEAEFPLNANAQAQLGEWPVYVIGSADVGGLAWQASQMATLTISERFLTVEMNPAACEQGQETVLICKVNPISEFTGVATAVLLGLPHEATAEAVEVAAGTEELHFKVRTTANTPAGQHKGLLCQLTVTEQDEPVVAVAGRGMLQVDVPLPQPVAQPPAAEAVAEAKPEPEVPAERPLTRLEKLRLEAKKLRDSRNQSENQ
ncbi:MAG TPA: PPC domain-containing protein, partial [Pirellulaceae bacterium]|nr:PPC domain-containing protein [Pirellulaceae bacterium]